ncbi:uncharacterized protein LOC134812265 [Bolinopsis microptera]|uniref:uncharacterized protein LOC134812265 n=1 Tax=Bolinopsis microptera TaxID=2820187 RepID=UPI003079CB71
MAMLFDQPLDDFSMDDLCGYNNTIIDQNFWDAEENKFNLGPLLPTPPLSPDQQLQLKQEAEAMEPWSTDAEVECYFSLNQSHNIVLNDRIWCDEKILTPTEMLDNSLKLMTPIMDDMVLNPARIRPITPLTPIKHEVNHSTPLKVDESPMKKQRQAPKPLQAPKFRLERFPIVKIKDEPVSPTISSPRCFFAPPPLKMTTESTFPDHSSSMTTVEIKEEPLEYVPPIKPDTRIRVTVKKEPSFDFTENSHSELVLKEPTRSPRGRSAKRQLQCSSSSSSSSSSKIQDVTIEERPVKTERRSSLRSSDSFSGEEEDEMIYLKRKLAEISSDSALSSSDDGLLSPKRRISQSRHPHNNSNLAEEAASKLSLEQLKNLSANHSHDDDEICSENCTKRFAHNVLERKRRNDLKDSYKRLQAEVEPISGSDRVSKVIILKKSAEYISEVEREEQESREELKQLRKHQKHLINKFKQLFRLTQQNSSNT